MYGTLRNVERILNSDSYVVTGIVFKSVLDRTCAFYLEAVCNARNFCILYFVFARIKYVTLAIVTKDQWHVMVRAQKLDEMEPGAKTVKA